MGLAKVTRDFNHVTLFGGGWVDEDRAGLVLLALLTFCQRCWRTRAVMRPRRHRPEGWMSQRVSSPAHGWTHVLTIRIVIDHPVWGAPKAKARSASESPDRQICRDGGLLPPLVVLRSLRQSHPSTLMPGRTAPPGLWRCPG